LIRSDLVDAALHKRLSTSIHAQSNLVVFDCRFHVGSALRFNKFALKVDDFFRVVKLDDIGGVLRTSRNQGAHDQHVRVPLHHDVGVVSEPNGTEGWWIALAIAQDLVMPTRIGRSSWLAQALMDTNGLYRKPRAEFPGEIVTRNKLSKSRVERYNVVVLQIDLDKGLPVVGALVNLDVVKAIIFKVEVLASFHAG